ncbi:MAG: hypothetical protein QRY71_00915 [Candidatus Rhabdochlamydia sp.]
MGINIPNIHSQARSSSESEESDGEASLKIYQKEKKGVISSSQKEEAKKTHIIGTETLSSLLLSSNKKSLGKEAQASQGTLKKEGIQKTFNPQRTYSKPNKLGFTSLQTTTTQTTQSINPSSLEKVKSVHARNKFIVPIKKQAPLHDVIMQSPKPQDKKSVSMQNIISFPTHQESIKSAKEREVLLTTTTNSLLTNPIEKKSDLSFNHQEPSKPNLLQSHEENATPPQKPFSGNISKINAPKMIPLTFEKAIQSLEALIQSSSIPMNIALSPKEKLEKILELLRGYIENKILTEDFIHQAYRYLFNSELAPFVQNYLGEEQSFIAPHPVQVIYTLVNCLKALPKEADFSIITEKSKAHVNKIRTIARDQGVDLFSISQLLQISSDPKIINLINHFAIYTATDWLSSDNLNPVFILKAQDFHPQWVFKPVMNLEGKQLERMLYRRDCEHFAFKMNFHKQFPIPAVFLIKIRGILGTIQPFIPNAIPFRDIPQNKQVLMFSSLQKLLIFDLLFLNHDRNGSNLLYRKQGELYACYGIDHEDSLKLQIGSATMCQIEIIDDVSHHLKFSDLDHSVRDLFSEKNCTQYRDILEECLNNENRLTKFIINDTEKMLDWIILIGKILRESTLNINKTVDQIVALIDTIKPRDKNKSYLND